jgi:CheY-like chemotaxis protein
MPGANGAELGKQIVTNPRLNHTRLILLTSSGQRGGHAEFALIGFAAYLLKPVSQRDLIDSMTLALAASAEDWHLQTQPIVTNQELQQLRGGEQRRVLLAEDNLVNQKVACRLLEKLGYRVDVAPDGAATVAAWQRGQYSLILMDCQMPGLDGFEATAEIRRREAGGKRIPIVALTADAMRDVQQKCLDAGMDDYLVKPIDRALLDACLRRFLPVTGQL